MLATNLSRAEKEELEKSYRTAIAFAKMLERQLGLPTVFVDKGQRQVTRRMEKQQANR